MFASVLYIQLTLGNGQRVIRERALIRSKDGKFFIDSIEADSIKLLFKRSRDTMLTNEKFEIVLELTSEVEIPKRSFVKIGEAILEVEKIEPYRFRVSKILKGGFIKSGNEVKIVKF
ncbi:MAG: hypothetical protein RMJ81_07100 [Candidatus Kryptonium sp.]|nr:hypothetical protein [Candidatus Kryptonium sp.]